MQTFYIFSSQTGNFIGTRGIAPEPESDEIGILQTPETLAQLTACLVPKLSNGQIVEGATPDQIDEIISPLEISGIRFWLGVLRVVGLTKRFISDYIITNMEEDLEKEEILILLEANSYERFNLRLLSMADRLNITKEQLDQIFIIGNSIVI